MEPPSRIPVKVVGERPGHRGRGTRSKDGLDPVRISTATDIAALAVERAPQLRGQLGDVVGEQEVRLFGDEQALDVDARRSALVTASEDIAVLCVFKKTLRA